MRETERMTVRKTDKKKRNTVKREKERERWKGADSSSKTAFPSRHQDSGEGGSKHESEA